MMKKKIFIERAGHSREVPQHLGLSAFTNTRRRRVISDLSAGFTLVELMIATSVFSILLLLALAGFLQIGQLFYKGVNITRTSDVAKQAITSIRDDISFDTSSAGINRYGPSPVTPAGQPTINRYWSCGGSIRYTYILGRQLDADAEANEMKNFPVSGWYRFALLKDRISVPPPACPNPFDPAAGNLINPNNVTEVLGDKMRLSNLTACPLSAPTAPPCPNVAVNTQLNKMYTVSIRIAYGDDSVLQNFDQPTAKCRSGANFARHCFVTELRTTVRKGLSP